MKATINIKGEIGVDVKLTDIISQMKKFPEPSELEININSVGGFVSHGREIFDYLASFNIPTTTIARGICASVATKLMLLGNERKVVEGTAFMIHNPFAATEGDADFLKEFSSELKKVENEFIAFYSEKLNQPEIAIKPLMKRETFLTEDELIALGFATEILPGSTKQKTGATLKAVAKLDLNQNPKSFNYMQLDQKSKKTLLEKIGNALGLFDAKAVLELTDDDGNILSFPGLEPEQMPSEGDAVSAENGTYTVDGQVMVVEGGEIVSVTPVEGAGDEDVEQMKKDLEELQQKYDEKKSALEEQEKIAAKAKKELEEIRNVVNDFELPAKPQPKTPAQQAKSKSSTSLPAHKKGEIKNKLTTNTK